MPRPSSAVIVPSGSEQARFVRVARDLRTSAWAEALSSVTILEASFAGRPAPRDGALAGPPPGPSSPLSPPHGPSSPLSPPHGPSSPLSPPPGASSGAAVLMPVLGGRERDDPARLVFIRRARSLRANPGDIAFAGGRLEPGEQPLDAALREAEEEIALDRNQVHVLGRLEPVFSLSVIRAGPIAAFVAVVRNVPTLVPNRSEVEEIVPVPLARLGDVSIYWEEEWILPPQGVSRRLGFFDLGADLLWGATARMSVLLLDALADTVAAGQAGGRGASG
ncbi:MAG: NUDIX hydrolase [Acidimicrobiales bacterium]